jgi:glutaredoxin
VNRATLTLYSKPGCHLCEDVREILDGLQPECGYAIVEIDITTDATLFARYRYEIPVVMKDGVELARGRMDEAALVALLRGTADRRG